ncbi:hypothetical protein ACIBG7_26965 [Nonomuraea sp. NPDC050328]|uniref:hypothetical protein n=1 Tax=Nonomuraea sp. NPDC050328 TaxID=3364361 RepID=UPI0037AE7BBF
MAERLPDSEPGTDAHAVTRQATEDKPSVNRSFLHAAHAGPDASHGCDLAEGVGLRLERTAMSATTPRSAGSGKGRARHRRIRAYMDQHGVPYSVAARVVDTATEAARDGHRHPAPDLGFLAGLPYAAGQPVDVLLATAAVAACRAGCGPCQLTLTPTLRRSVPTVAALAGGVYGMLPTPGRLAHPATRAWHPLARQAGTSGERADAETALAALAALPEQDLAAILEDALDLWAAAAAQVSAHLVDVDPGHSRDDENEDENENGEKGDEDGVDGYGRGPIYALYPATARSESGEVPVLVLSPERGAAGVEDLTARAAWPSWDLTAMPALDPRWQVQADIAGRALTAIVRLDDDGFDDLILWRAPEPAPLPPHWWDLLDRTGAVLVCGPVDPPSSASDLSVLQEAAAAGSLLAAITKVSFR